MRSTLRAVPAKRARPRSASLVLTVIGLIAALHFTTDTLFAQRGRRQLNPSGAANNRPPGVIASDRTEELPKAADDGQPVALRGIMRDDSDEPVAKATVWLVNERSERHYQNAFDPPIETQTDADGRFSFGEVDEERFFGPHTNWMVVVRTTVVARDAKGRIGWHEIRRHSRADRECEIHLREATQLTGRVLDGQGNPLAGVRLTAYEFLGYSPDEKRFLSEICFPFPALASEYSTVTAADGTYRLSGVPRCEFIECQLLAPGVRRAFVFLKVSEEGTIRVSLPGKITGSLPLPEDARQAMAGHRLEISSEGPTERLPWVPLQVYETTTVDEHGRFEFDGLPPERYSIASAYHENAPYFAIGTKPIEVKEGEHVSEVPIALTRLRKVTGRIVDRETGRAVPAVQLVGMNSNYSRDPPHLHLRAVTDGDGRFAFWLTAGRAQVVVDRVPIEYLPPLGRNGSIQEVADGQWPLIEFERAAKIEATVVDDAGLPVPFARLGIDPAHAERSEPSLPYQCDRDGRFRVSQLAPSDPVALRARTSTAATPSPVTVTPAELHGPIRLVVSRNGACSISGHVVDQAGRPLPTATVSLVERRDTPQSVRRVGTRHESVTYVRLAADGHFQTEALWPGVQYYVRVSATGFGDYESRPIQGEAGKVYDVGQITLEPFRLITGEVVDGQGRPVPDAELRIALPDGSPVAGRELLELRSDRAGWFVLPRVKNDGTLNIWARAGRATTDGVQSFAMREVKEKLRIVMTEENACRLTGKVVDGEGRPVPSASIGVVWEWDKPGDRGHYASRRSDRWPKSEIVLGDSLAGEDGTFATAGLWPGEHYHLRIAAGEHETVELPAILGEGGTTAEAGPIVLRRNDRSIGGTVVDASGHALADATVLDSGDAEKVLIARTDAAGRFRLEGLFEGPIHVLVRKDGYWPAGWRGRAGETGPISLTTIDRPRPVSHLPDVGDALLPEREVVRRLLTELWRRRDTIARGDGRVMYNMRRHPTGPLDGQFVGLVAAVDPDLAFQWSASQSKRLDSNVHRALLRRAIYDDKPAEGERNPYVLLAVAKRRLDAGRRDEVMPLLEDALRGDIASDATRQPQGNLVRQAQIGALAIAAGRDEWGRSLVCQAADRVEELGGVGATLDARGEVAIALARFDAPRALSVWEMPPLPPPNERGNVDMLRIRLAVALGHDDPQAASRLASEQQVVVRDNLIVEIARTVAERDTDKALAMLDQLPSQYPFPKAQALARIATAIAPREPSRAYDLIDRGLAMCLPGAPDERRHIINYPEAAGRIAVAAAELGYPDMRTVVDFVLASRLSAEELRIPINRTRPAINTVRLLALVDPAISRELLGRVPRPADRIDTREGDAGLAEWLQAWGLVDPQRAEQIFRDILVEQDPLTTQCVQSSLLPMLELLVMPRAARAALISRESVLPYGVPGSGGDLDW